MKKIKIIAITTLVLAMFAAIGMVFYNYFPTAFDFLGNKKSPQQPTMQNEDMNNAPKAVKIGAILPLTGNLSFLGTPGKNAIALFKEQYPDSNVEISLYDSQADPKTAISEFRRAYDFDGVRFFVTTLTGVCLGVKPVSIDKGTFQACIAIYPDLASGSALTFQTCYNAIAEAECIVNYIKTKRFDGLFIFASRDAVTEVELNKYILPSLKKSNINLVIENFDLGTKDFKQIVAKFRSSGVSQAVLLGYGSDFQGILRELANQKLTGKVQIIGGIGYLELPNYVGYDLVKNSVFVSPQFLVQGSNNESYMQFKSEYKNAFGTVPTYDAAYTYDTVLALSNAADRVAHATPDAIAEYLEKNTIQGVTGQISFTASRQLKVEVVMAKYDEELNITIVE